MLLDHNIIYNVNLNMLWKYKTTFSDILSSTRYFSNLKMVSHWHIDTEMWSGELGSTTPPRTPRSTHPGIMYSWLLIPQTLANSNQSRFPLDFHHTFTVILPSVTRTLNNLNLPLTWSNFCFPSDHFYIILSSITQTML